MEIVDDSIFINPNNDSILGIERDFYDYLASNRTVPDPSCCCAPKYVEPGFKIDGYGEQRFTKDDIPKVDLHWWADVHHLKMSEDGKTLTCYKAVEKTETGKYRSLSDPNFEYIIGEYASCYKFDTDQLDECSYGLHGTSLKGAEAYSRVSILYNKNVAYLELKVDVSNPDNYVIPYYGADNGVIWYREKLLKPANKFRFKKCFVTREVQFKLVAKDINTGEEFDW